MAIQKLTSPRSVGSDLRPPRRLRLTPGQRSPLARAGTDGAQHALGAGLCHQTPTTNCKFEPILMLKSCLFCEDMRG